MKSIRTEITIDAPVEQVWNTLTKFTAYPQWNPFITTITGKAKEGTQLVATIHPPGGKAMTFRPTVLRSDKNREFRWLGKLFVKGLFDGEHYFILTPINEQQTQLEHGEHFRGLLVNLIMKQIEGNTMAGFEAMNQALKERAESQA